MLHVVKSEFIENESVQPIQCDQLLEGDLVVMTF